MNSGLFYSWEASFNTIPLFVCSCFPFLRGNVDIQKGRENKINKVCHFFYEGVSKVDNMQNEEIRQRLK